MTALKASNLWRYYGQEAALKGIDLDVPAGSAYGFIGPNGSGKSTTLRLLATLDRPDAGRIWIDGQDAWRQRDRLRPTLGFMPDPFHFPQDLKVEEMLRYFAAAYRLPHREQRKRVERAIELTGIGAEREKPCEKLSKGWRQRVLLAKTLVHDPQLLLLDEPAAGLDPAARIEFRNIIRALRELGKTIVVSSHILSELADFCDSVGIIEGGRMLVSGRIETILARLKGHDELLLSLLGDPAPALALLSACPEVSSWEREGEEAGGPVQLRLCLSQEATPELRAKLLRLLIDAQVKVFDLSVRSRGLEELFLHVASQLAPGKSAPASRDLRALLAEPSP